MTAASTIISGTDMTDKIDQMTEAEAKAALRKSVEIMKRTHEHLTKYRQLTNDYIRAVSYITYNCPRCRKAMDQTVRIPVK